MQAAVVQALETLKHDRPGNISHAIALLQHTVFSFSMKVCGHRQDAEDTMQETLLKTVGYLKRFDNPKALTVWLYKVAKNHCLMSRRKSKFAPKESLSLEELMPDRNHLEQLGATRSENPEQSLLRTESREQVQQAVLNLPPAYRLVLVLHDMEGLSTDEIAEVLGLREGTVRVRLHRARVFTRNELAKGYSKPRRQKKRAKGKPRRCRKLFAELSDYLDDSLDESLCGDLEKHIDGCQPCQTFLDSLEQTVERCRRHRSERMDPRAAARIRTAVLADYRRALTAARPRDHRSRDKS